MIARPLKLGAALSALALLSGCAGTTAGSNGLYARPIGNAPVTANPTPYSAEHDEPWPGGRSNHYLFDMNRDWFAQSQPETRGRIKIGLEYVPQITVDLHEQGGDNTYYFAPPRIFEGLLTSAGHYGLELQERARSLLAHTLINQALTQAYQDLFFLIAILHVGLLVIAGIAVGRSRRYSAADI